MRLADQVIGGWIGWNAMNIYVGNLPYSTTESELIELFSQYGTVERGNLVNDRETGRPRGFGFVEMPNEEEGRKAIETLNDFEYEGRSLTVNEARPRGSGSGGGNKSGDGGQVRQSGGYSRRENTGSQGYSRSSSSGYSNQKTGGESQSSSDSDGYAGGYSRD